MLINILITMFGLFLVIAFESFFVTLISFSIMIPVVFMLMDKMEWKKWLVLTSVCTFLIDILLHRSVGITLLSVSVSSSVLYLLFLIVPKKQLIVSYIPYFFSILIFYILLDLLSPLVQDSVWGTLTWIGLLGDALRSVVATVLVSIVNTVISNFRSKDQFSL